MVRVLDIKVMRDLWSMRTQVLSIALLIGSGVAIFVMSVSNYQALVSAMDEHYRNERFADIFASLKRAPNSVIPRLREIDGIGIVEPRISQPVRVIRPDTVLPDLGAHCIDPCKRATVAEPFASRRGSFNRSSPLQ